MVLEIPHEIKISDVFLGQLYIFKRIDGFYATDLRASIISWFGVSKDCAISRAVWPIKESN